MDRIDLTQFDEDGFTIKLVGPPGLIAVDTLIETLAGFSQSLEAIGDAVDPHYSVEVLVDRIAPGSVEIGVRVKRRRQKGARSGTAAMVTSTVIIGLFTNFLYDQIKPQEKCAVDVGAHTVTVKGDNCEVTVSREAHDLMPRIEGNPNVAAGIERALRATKKDRAVQSVGIAARPGAPPAVIVTRRNFDQTLRRLDQQRELFDGARSVLMAGKALSVVPERRTRTIRADLTVIKAVLLRSRRKWQFNWQGINVSAKIVDAHFFDQLETRSLALRQGDALDADLEIKQRFIPDAKVWENESYTVTKVYKVRLGETQTTMDFTSPVATPQLAPPARGGGDTQLD